MDGMYRTIVALRVVRRFEDIKEESRKQRRHRHQQQEQAVGSPPPQRPPSPTITTKKDPLQGLVVDSFDFSMFPGGASKFVEENDVRDCFFVNCRNADDMALAAAGAIVVDLDTKDLPLKPLRNTLYDIEEIRSTDQAIYEWTKSFRGGSQRGRVASYLHDGCILDALVKRVSGKSIVGIMGGHGMVRADPSWAQVARLCWRLAREGFTIATGGGPGAMEAANMGAFLAKHEESELEEAIRAMATASNEGFKFEYQNTKAADAVLARFGKPGDGEQSVGVPTFHYGHEPSNRFCGGLAKFVSNAIREDILIAICNSGIVFCPGAAGTRTEIFQQGVPNSYSPETPQNFSKPMVFLNSSFWLQNGLFETLLNLAQREDADRGRPNGWSKRIWCLDDNDEIVRALVTFRGEKHGVAPPEHVPRPPDQGSGTIATTAVRAVDEAIAAGHIGNGSIVGIGSGWGPTLALGRLAAEAARLRWRVTCVPSSDSSFARIVDAAKSTSGAIVRGAFSEVCAEDVVFVEAGAADFGGSGGGGAGGLSVSATAAAEEGCMAAERILVMSASRVVAIAVAGAPHSLRDSGAITVDVLPFAVSRAPNAIGRAVAGVAATLRKLPGGFSTPHVTDTGCLVLDVTPSSVMFDHFGGDVAKVVDLLHKIPGVTEVAIHCCSVSTVYFC